MILQKLEYAGACYSNCTPEYLAECGVPPEVIAAALASQVVADTQAARRAAYAVESDPLYLEWQYDKTAESEQAWRDKVTEIKARYPLPGE